MSSSKVILDSGALRRALARISHEIIEKTPHTEKLGLIGLPTRGFHLAQRIAQSLQQISQVAIPVGQMDITFHRDDLDRHIPIPHSTHIPFDTTDRIIILVDDVLFTGRTVRAALNALSDFGRPAAIQLVALIDRGHRQLPIRADYVGKNIPTALTDNVQVKLEEVDGLDSVEVIQE
jgi:pyrimidine operon attenuation protein / uracil phosphoribosyltransferase